MIKFIKKFLKWILVCFGGLVVLYILVTQVPWGTLGTPASTALSSEYDYQSKYESKIKGELHQFLSALMSKNAFVVSVHTELPDKETKEEVVMTPKRITTKNEDKMTGDLETLMVARPSTKSIRLLNKHGLKLPGLVGPTSTVETSLPGFPTLAKRNPTASDTTKEEVKEKKELLFTQSEENVYYNKETNHTVTSLTTLKRMDLSIVVDKGSFEGLDMKKASLIAMIKDISGFKVERGDKLSLRFTEFQGFGFKFNRFVEANSPKFSKTIDFLQRFNWLVLGAILLIGGALAALYPLAKWMLAKRRGLQLAKAAAEDEKRRQALLLSKQVKEDFKRQRREIAQLSDQKPEVIAHHIVGWINDADDVDDADEAKGGPNS